MRGRRIEASLKIRREGREARGTKTKGIRGFVFFVLRAIAALSLFVRGKMCAFRFSFARCQTQKKPHSLRRRCPLFSFERRKRPKGQLVRKTTLTVGHLQWRHEKTCKAEQLQGARSMLGRYEDRGKPRIEPKSKSAMRKMGDERKPKTHHGQKGTEEADGPSDTRKE